MLTQNSKKERTKYKGLVSLQEIADTLGVCERTVWADYTSAMKKLTALNPGIVGILFRVVPRSLPRNCSVECLPEYQLWKNERRFSVTSRGTK